MTPEDLAYIGTVVSKTAGKMTVDRSILVLLTRRPETTSDLGRFFGQLSAVKAAVKRLRMQGWVEAGSSVAYGGAQRTYYQITDLGRLELECVLRNLSHYCDPERSDFSVEEADHIHQSILKIRGIRNVNRERVLSIVPKDVTKKRRLRVARKTTNVRPNKTTSKKTTPKKTARKAHRRSRT